MFQWLCCGHCRYINRGTEPCRALQGVLIGSGQQQKLTRDNMNCLVLIASVCIAITYGQNIISPPLPEPRFLRADVLRDFPGVCFGATALRLFKVGESWDLKPFCGNATCGRVNNQFMERVLDCGIKPKESPGCRVINEEDIEKPFPQCCPKYQCEEGATLEFPTEEEIKAAARDNAARHGVGPLAGAPPQGGGRRPNGATPGPGASAPQQPPRSNGPARN